MLLDCITLIDIAFHYIMLCCNIIDNMMLYDNLIRYGILLHLSKLLCTSFVLYVKTYYIKNIVLYILYYSISNSVLLYYIILYSIKFCSTILYSNILLYQIKLCYIILHYIALHYITIHYMKLNYIILYCIVLESGSSWEGAFLVCHECGFFPHFSSKFQESENMIFEFL